MGPIRSKLFSGAHFSFTGSKKSIMKTNTQKIMKILIFKILGHLNPLAVPLLSPFWVFRLPSIIWILTLIFHSTKLLNRAHFHELKEIGAGEPPNPPNSPRGVKIVLQCSLVASFPVLWSEKSTRPKFTHNWIFIPFWPQFGGGGKLPPNYFFGPEMHHNDASTHIV